MDDLKEEEAEARGGEDAGQLVFVGINVTFIGAILLTPVGAVSTVLFTLLGYGLVVLSIRLGRAGLVGGLIAYIALFTYMRRYDFLTLFVPEDMLTSILMGFDMFERLSLEPKVEKDRAHNKPLLKF